MNRVDEELAREIATETLLSQTMDIEYIIVQQMVDSRPEVVDYSEEEFEAIADAVSNLVRWARVEVVFP